ncbi:hypothetical protein IAR50_001925 [Cryptococcus sp. DSM 104548]
MAPITPARPTNAAGQAPRPPFPQQQFQPMPYPQQGFYPAYPYDQAYPMPQQQWAPQHHPQAQYPQYNPRPVPFQPGQPAAYTGSAPGTPVQAIRPPGPGPLAGHQPTSSTSSQSSIPSTPVRSPANFTPLSGGSSSFTPGGSFNTPRRSTAIKISRPDGSALNLMEEALKSSSAKGPSASNSNASTPASPSTPAAEVKDAPKKPAFSLPVVVKIEKPEDQKERLREEALKAQEAREEQERRERREKQAKQDAEKKIKEEEEQKAKEEAEKKAKEEEDKKASEVPEKVETAAPAPGSGLPPKPVAAVNELKAADSAPESPALSEPSTPSYPLNSAQPIDDIHSINYPGSLKSPNAELNVSAEPRKFRYDREFLIQFMGVCKEKPESLPNLKEIGLEADGSSGFGSRYGGRSSGSGFSRGSGSTGLGINGINKPSMGSGGFGNFSSGPSSIRNTTSEQRYRASMQGRSPSQGGPGGIGGLPAMGMSSSRGGVSRGSQRGSKRAPQQPAAPPAPAIPISENAWTRTRLGGNDESSPVYIERKVKALLNKLTEEKFDPISKQILEWANKSANEENGMTVKLVIKLIFEKATDEAHWSQMYAKLCVLLHDQLDPAVAETIDNKPYSGRALFRRYLLGRCQQDFESGWKAREDTANAAAAKEKEDGEKMAEKEKAESTEDKEAVLMSDEYYAAQKAKRRGLGLVQLIGELFKREILSSRVINGCLSKLLSNLTNPDEEDLESACKLLTTVGEKYSLVAPDQLNGALAVLSEIEKIEGLPSRIRFMILDVHDLRRDGWRSNKNQTSVMTIAEIHKKAAQEKSAAASKESISRGGSRSGGRRDQQQPGEWQSVSAPRMVSRPADFHNLGRNMTTAGTSPSFGGPSSVFSKKGGRPGVSTPPTPSLSRPSSSANMFSALTDENHEAAAERRESADAGESTQRKKLSLAPRTKPLPGDGEEYAQEDEGSADEKEAEGETEGLDEAGAKAKVDLDMKELWGEKDAGGSRNPQDVVEYFKSLPEAYRPLLAKRLLEDVFRIAKPKDAEVVAKSWKAAVEAQVVGVEVLKATLEERMPGLDDESVDFPGAYVAVAQLVRSVALPVEEIDALAGKIDVWGEPRVTPKQKLEKALTKVDEEA